jgi:membrane protease YdiL (CAAX protease family)
VARRGRARGRAPRVDPFLAFALFAAVGVATWTLDQPVRLSLTWLVLLICALICASGQRLQFSYTFSGLARGAVAGLVISLPLALIGSDFLLATSQRVFPSASVLSLFWSIVLIMPSVEALFFRGLVQSEKGLWPSVLLYAAAGVVYFLPATWDGHLPVLGVLVGGMGLLGFVYSYVRAMHGMVASLVCQAMVHFVLFVAPSLVGGLLRSVGS